MGNSKADEMLGLNQEGAGDPERWVAIKYLMQRNPRLRLLLKLLTLVSLGRTDWK